jgi:hypothetical protein
MNIPFLGLAVDERFLTHRLRSSSVAGMITSAGALLVFLYRHYVDHVWSWDLLAVGVAFVAVKLALFTFYVLTD